MKKPSGTLIWSGAAVLVALVGGAIAYRAGALPGFRRLAGTSKPVVAKPGDATATKAAEHASSHGTPRSSEEADAAHGHRHGDSEERSRHARRAKVGREDADEDDDLRTADSEVAALSATGPAVSPVALGIDPAPTRQFASGFKADQCSSIEYWGLGPVHTRVAADDWTRAMVLFHDAKRELGLWIERQSAALPAGAAARFQASVERVKLQRPPVLDEPDLAWRGTAVWSDYAGDGEVIKVGGGFLRLVQQEPKRARFELARALALSLGPCELPAPDRDAWRDLGSCLGVSSGADACGSGALSEMGWAVATALAHEVAPPGCRIPRTEASDGKSCVRAAFARAPASAASPSSSAATPAVSAPPAVAAPTAHGEHS